MQDLFAGDAAHAWLVGAQRDHAVDLVDDGGAQDAAGGYGCGTAGRAAGALALGDGARGGDPSQVLAAVRLDDHVIAELDAVVLTRVVLAAVALEADLYDLGHARPS